jgi:arabinan endo-1,5-alpha-L-arabinosidase
MNRHINGLLLLMVILLVSVTAFAATDTTEIGDIVRADLFIRDPFIVPDVETQTYYLYKSDRITLKNGQRRPGVVAYTSKDLQTWRGPYPVFHYPNGLWANGSIWAPEVHKYQGKYYLFATFNSDKPIVLPEGRPKSGLRATQICVAESPLGPFRIFENTPHTPTDWLSLDGTLWVENGIPYMIFCHEWVQITDGTMDLVRLKPDLSAPEGKPQTLFKATDAQWVKTLRGKHEGTVTDGCFLHRTKSDTLLMIWSSFGDHKALSENSVVGPRASVSSSGKDGEAGDIEYIVDGAGRRPDGKQAARSQIEFSDTAKYTVGMARSVSGKVTGPWEQIPKPLVARDGGHGMLFQSFDGRLIMPIHQPNSGPIRMHLYELEDAGDTLRVKGEL